MRKYVIWVSEGDTKGYIRVGSNGTEFVKVAAEATPLPNRVAASAVVQAIKPEIKKKGFDVKIGIEAL